MDEALRAKILNVLQSHHLMTLATIRSDGFPQATIVNYVHDGLTLYFATEAASQKAGNIKLNNKVSVAIASKTDDFYKLRGLSMSGVAARLLEKETAEDFLLRLFRTLILDEPNSNLDTDGEAALDRALKVMKTAKVTVVIVTHKPQILRHADRVLVMAEGAVKLFGERDQVMAKIAGPKVASIKRSPAVSSYVEQAPASMIAAAS